MWYMKNTMQQAIDPTDDSDMAFYLTTANWGHLFGLFLTADGVDAYVLSVELRDLLRVLSFVCTKQWRTACGE